ncbi:MAG: hypothetical protein ACRC6V_14450 [Bacteroidales bacterium]
MKTPTTGLMYKVSALLEEGEIISLFELIKQDLIIQSMNTKPNEGQRREELYHMTHGISLLERKMTELSNDFKEND